MHMARTELRSPFAINSRVCPIIGPINFSRVPNREDGLDCESHPRFADSHRLVLGVMRYPRWRVEFGVDAVTSPGRNNITVPGLRVTLNGLTEVSEWAAGLHKLNCLIQAFSCRFNHSDRIRVRLCSIADIVRFIQVSVMTIVI